MHQSASPVPELSAVLDRIRSWATANNWKPATLARKADVADNVTRDMDDADWSPSGNSIRRLEAIIPDGWRSGDPVPVEKPKRHRAQPARQQSRRKAA